MRELKLNFLTLAHEALLQRAGVKLQRHELRVIKDNVPTLSIPTTGILRTTLFDYFEDAGYQITPVYSDGEKAFIIDKGGINTTRSTVKADALEAEDILIECLIIGLIRDKQEKEMEADNVN